MIRARWKLATGIILSGVFLCAVALWMKKPADAVVKIDGNPITREHLALYEEDCRAKVTSYFYSQYNQDPNEEGFWDRNINGEIPSEMLKEEALTRLWRDTVERIEAKKHGISTDITLDQIKKSLKAENKRRKSSGQVIYGPDQYGLSEYLSRTQMDVRNALKEELLKQELKPDEAQLKELYEKTDQAFFSKGCRAKVGIFTYSAMKVGDYPEELESAWAYVKEELLKGGPPESIAALASQAFEVEISYDTMEYDTTSIEKDNQVKEWMADQTRKLPAGQWSEVLEYQASQVILLVLEKEDYGLADQEESQKQLITMWINEAYEDYLTQSMKKYGFHKQ